MIIYGGKYERKKVIILSSLFLIVLLLLCFNNKAYADLIMPVQNPTLSEVKGDINGDGKLTVTDVSVVKLVLVGLKNESAIAISRADFNNDGKLSAVDLSKLKLELVGLGQNTQIAKIDENKDIVYTIDRKLKYGEDKTIEVKIPQINLDCKNIKELNQKILSDFNEDKVLWSQDPIKYYINNNIISFVIYWGTEGDKEKYDVYNIDISTGNFLTNNQIITAKNMTREEFITKAQDKMNKLFEERFKVKENDDKDWIKSVEQSKGITTEYLNDKFNNTIINQPVFLNDEGNICVIITTVFPAGSGGPWDEILVIDSDNKGMDLNFNNSILKIDENKDIIYTINRDLKYGDNQTLEVKIPQINLDCKNVKELNQKLLNDFSENKTLWRDDPIKYYINDNIISFVIHLGTPGGMEKYDVYNIDINTGNFVTSNQIITTKNMTREEFITKAQAKMNKIFDESFKVKENDDKDWRKTVEYAKGITTEYLNDKFDNTIISQPVFLNEKGNICMVIKILSVTEGDYLVDSIIEL